MHPEQKKFARRQSASAAKLWLISLACILGILLIIFWPRQNKPKEIKRYNPPAPLVSRPDPMGPRRLPPPRVGFRNSQPVYESTNLGSWFADLQSTNPATVQRAREALAALGVETSSSTNVPSAAATNSPPAPVSVPKE